MTEYSGDHYITGKCTITKLEPRSPLRLAGGTDTVPTPTCTFCGDCIGDPTPATPFRDNGRPRGRCNCFANRSRQHHDSLRLQQQRQH